MECTDPFNLFNRDTNASTCTVRDLVHYVQGCLNPCRLITQASAICRAGPNFFIKIIAANFHLEFCITSHATSRKRSERVKLAGHSRIVGPQYRSCFISPFWRLEFLSDAHIFGGLAFIQRLRALYCSHNKHSVKLLLERLVFVRRCNVHFVTDVDIHKYFVD